MPGIGRYREEGEVRPAKASIAVLRGLGLLLEHPEKPGREKSDDADRHESGAAAEDFVDVAGADRADRGRDAHQRAQCPLREIEASGAGRQVGNHEDGEDGDHCAADAVEQLHDDEERISGR